MQTNGASLQGGTPRSAIGTALLPGGSRGSNYGGGGGGGGYFGGGGGTYRNLGAGNGGGGGSSYTEPSVTDVVHHNGAGKTPAASLTGHADYPATSPSGGGASPASGVRIDGNAGANGAIVLRY